MIAPAKGNNDLIECNQLHFTTNSFASTIPLTIGSVLLTPSNRNSSLFVGTMKTHVNGKILIVVTPATANKPHGFRAPRFLADV